MSILLPLALLLLAPTPQDPAATQDPRHTPEPDRGEPLASPGDRWPGFRGVGTSHSAAVGLPREWSAEEGLAWSVDLPGFGQSSPVVLDGRVYVTAARGSHKELCVVACHDLVDGAVLWVRTFEASTRIEATEYVSRAAPTPAVDASGLYCFFESGDVIALSHEGELRWRRDLVAEYGPFEGNHGVGSSVVLDDSGVLLLLDHEGPSYLIKLDRATGANVWRQEREPRVSWSTPVLASATGGGQELVVSSNGVLQGIDVTDGALRWELADLRGNTVPSPTVLGDRVLVASSKDDPNRLVRRGAPGGAAEILWEADSARPSSFGSPLVAGGRVHIVNRSGALFCVSLATGEALWELRLPESCWASPVAAEGLLWFFGKEGTTVVLRADDEGAEEVARNVLPMETLYGVALVDGAILLREGGRLHCIRTPVDGPDDEEPPGEADTDPGSGSGSGSGGG